jgi:hypothetical protein
MAQMLLQEINRSQYKKKNYDRDRDFDIHLREACSRAALRLIYTSSQSYVSGKRNVNENTPGEDVSSSDILPLQALGDKDFLAKIVTETQAGMASIEDSKLLKKEIKQLEVWD